MEYRRMGGACQGAGLHSSFQRSFARGPEGPGGPSGGGMALSSASVRRSTGVLLANNGAPGGPARALRARIFNSHSPVRDLWKLVAGLQIQGNVAGVVWL